MQVKIVQAKTAEDIQNRINEIIPIIDGEVVDIKITSFAPNNFVWIYTAMIIYKESGGE